ncbi:MAG: PAS domain S-box protein [Verrucomicrobiota bacterium]
MQQFDELDTTWTGPLFHENPVPMALVAPDHRFTRCNDSFCSLLGYARSELTSRTWQSITHPDDVAGDQAGKDQLRLNRSNEVYTLAKRYLSKQGNIHWVNLHVRAIWDGNTFLGYYSVALPVASHGVSTDVAVKPKSLVEWIKSNPQDAFLVGGATGLFLGRDTVIEIIHHFIGK